MNQKRYKSVLHAGLLGALALGWAVACAQPVEESTYEVEKRVLEAHVKVVHLDTLQKTESGMYYATLKKGTGPKVKDTCIVLVNQTILDMNYNITASNKEDIAHQLGDYDASYAYLPLLWHVGYGSNYVGVEEMIQTMYQGEVRRMWIPYWLAAAAGGTSTATSTTVYDIEVTEVIEDIEQYEIDHLEAYRLQKYPTLDSLAKGYYKKTLKASQGDSLTFEDKVKVRYVGRFLNGHVFDTNIADTATKYSLYDASKDYAALNINLPNEENWKANLERITNPDGTDSPTGTAAGASEMEAIAGFIRTLLDMRKGEEAVTFFHSGYGYGVKGSSGGSYVSSFIHNGSIPPYMPLCFWIKVEND